MAAFPKTNDRSKERDNTGFGDEGWTTKDAKAMYLVDRWGGGYFEINAEGDMTVLPLLARGGRIVIREVVEAARQKGLTCPLLIRFQDILHHRVRALNEAFNAAISRKRLRPLHAEFSHQGESASRSRRRIVDAGRPFHYGWRSDQSRTVQTFGAHDNDSLIICNGYKAISTSRGADWAGSARPCCWRALPGSAIVTIAGSP